ncbi:MAG: hypothetical protein ABI864_06605 [Chloroflexota bacterium]
MKSRRLLVVLTSFALLLSATASTAIAAKPTGVGTQKTQRITKVGTTRIVGNAARPVQQDQLAGETRPDPDELSEAEIAALIHRGGGGSHVPSSHVPRPATKTVVDATGTFHRDGLNHYDQRFAGTGTSYENTQYSLEPPDQGLCVGNGFVVETVNTAIRVRNTGGTVLVPAMPINDFFNVAPEIVRPSGPYGPFSTDPKCYFDDAADRWFVTVLEIDVDATTGAFAAGAHLYIAVSQSGDPTGVFNIFAIDVTNDGTGGTPTHNNCPCFGDQPLIGADANGFYVTTNEYPIFVSGFNGANVYAMSKSALASGSLGTVATFYEPTLAEGQAYSLQPATTPPGAAFESANGGTEYLLSALEFTGGLDNRIALWALTNTSSLSSTPALTMNLTIVDSEVYGAPPVMTQKDGSTPLRDLLKIPDGAAILGLHASGEQLNLLNSNDDRMNQAVFVSGKVWGALNTVVKSPTGAARTAIAWFSVSPTWSGATLGGSISSQGYVAVANNSVAFPAVAANASGKVIVGFSLVGPDYYPAAAYAQLSPTPGNVKVVRFGSGPADGFTGYVALDPGDRGVERWGDYSAATADEAGNLWFATESINQSCSLNTFLSTNFTCGGTRTILANWGTTIARVAP